MIVRAFTGLLVVAIGALAQYWVAASAGSGVVSLPYSDDFSKTCAPWPVGNDEQGSFGCVRGAYRLHLRTKPVKDEYFKLAAAATVTTMAISADVWTRSPGRIDSSGVGCWTTANTGYLFTLSTRRRTFDIERALFRAGRRDRYIELKGTELGSPPLRDVNRLRAVCTFNGDGTASFDLWLNGVHAERARDPHASGRFRLFGFNVAPFRRGADFFFDNLVVKTS